MIKAFIAAVVFALGIGPALAEFSGPFPQNPVQFIGATGDTTDRSGQINAALATYGRVQLGCGTFFITNSVNVPSNGDFGGSGPCTVLQASTSLNSNPQWPTTGGSVLGKTMIDNSNFAGGNVNIHVHDMTVQLVSSPNNTHLIAFYNLVGMQADHLIVIGDGTTATFDGFATIKTSFYTISDNKVSGVGTVCYDNWNEVHDFSIANNHCDGGGVTQAAVQVNGNDGTATVHYAYNGSISGNTSYNTTYGGIGVVGLTVGGVQSIVRNIAVTGNTVDLVTLYHGIDVGAGLDISITGNVVRNVGSSGIRVAPHFAGDTTTNVTIAGNTIDNANTAATNSPAIYIGPGSSYVSEIGNEVIGSLHTYAIKIDAAASYNTLIAGPMTAGTVATVLDSSTNSMRQWYDDIAGYYKYGSSGGICFGVSDVACTWKIATYGTLFPNTANSVNIGQAGGEIKFSYVNSPVVSGTSPSNSGSCNITNKLGGNAGGTFTLNGGCAGGTVVLGFQNAYGTDVVCPPITNANTKIAYPQSNTAASTNSATFTVTGSNGDLFRFGPCAGF